MINLLNPDGTYNENAGKYAGIDRLARAQTGRRRPEGTRPARAGRLVSRASQSLGPQQDADRTLPVGPVVRADGGRRRRSLRALPSRPWTPSPRDGSRFTPTDTPRAISTGWARSATGASAASSGGVIASRSGTAEPVPKTTSNSAFSGRPDVAWRQAEAGGWLDLRRDRPERRRAGARPYA